MKSANGRRIPLYKQLYDNLREQFDAGTWQEGNRIPSENELATRFHVSRITVKQALDQLELEGYVYRIQGKGTFAAAPGHGEPRLPSLKVEKDKSSKPSEKEPTDHPPLLACIMPRLDNAFTAHILSGIEEVLANAGCKMLFSKSRDSHALEKQLIREAIACGARGLIIHPLERERYNEELLQLSLNRFPLVLIDRVYRGIGANSVCSDHFGGAYAATRHLIEHGHRSIAFIAGSSLGTSSIEDRLAGYEKALADHGLPILHQLRLLDATEETIHLFLQQQPEATAVFADQYFTGIEVEKAASAVGRSIPESLSLVFFDEYEFAEWSRVPPTVVLQQEEEIGRRAADLLLSLMADPSGEPRHIVLPTELRIGSSTRPLTP